MKLTFLGAAQTVTGSKYLLETDNQKRILIDCGMFQGLKQLRLRNWDTFPIDPKTIDALVLTHAHIDHSGYIPRLIKLGFRGPVYCTEATFDLCKIMLTDSGYLQEEEAARANKYGYSRHKPALPLYTEADAEAALAQFKPVAFDKDFALFEGAKIHFVHAGHILGAASVTVTCGDTRLAFSGDLGRRNDPIMQAPTKIAAADYVVVESTYGDRLHENIDSLAELEKVINRTVSRGGSVIIPAFAVGRAQLIMYLVHELKKAKRIPDVPAFLDSPMAIDASELFCKHHEEHKLSAEQARAVCHAVKYTHTVKESKQLDQFKYPSIIISASGMATGGRVLHHIRAAAGDHRNTILFVGYQAAGTRGEKMVDGAKTVRMFGQDIMLHAEVVEMSHLSAHADYEGVLDWLSGFKQAPKTVFVTHGEETAAAAMREKIQQKFGWKSVVPTLGESFTL